MRKKIIFAFSFLLLLATACTVSYKMNGASIDYSKTKTVCIKDFNNLAPLVNPALAPQFNEALRDIFARQTRLKAVDHNGDMQLEGEIMSYDIIQLAMQADGVAAETKLSVTVKVRYSNRVNPTKNFEKSFTAFRTFPNTQTLQQVESQLCTLIVEELTETIYNQTAADW